MNGAIAERESEAIEGTQDTSIYSNNKVILNANGTFLISYFLSLNLSKL